MIPNSTIQRRNRRSLREGFYYLLLTIAFFTLVGLAEWLADPGRVKPVDNPYSYFNMPNGATK